MGLWYIPLIVSTTLLVLLPIGYYFTFYQHPFQRIDRSSGANINEVVTKHFMVDLYIDFPKQILSGQVTHTFLALKDNVNMVALDMQLLTIKAVSQDNNALDYKINSHDWVTDLPNQVLYIYLKAPLSKNQELNVTIQYSTSPLGTGLNWLTVNQTTTGKPFLFTECETNLARSTIPIQDTPSVKATFSARISLPSDNNFTVLVSGIRQKSYSTSSGVDVIEFQQRVPIPSYLFTILAGKLASIEIPYEDPSKKIMVYAEPGFIEQSYAALKHIGSYLQYLESHLTPFLWTYYTIVVLPDGYTGEGMENPGMIYLAKTLIESGVTSENIPGHELV